VILEGQFVTEYRHFVKLKLMIPNRSDSMAQGSSEIFSRFPMALESPCRRRKRAKSDFFNGLKKPGGQHPSVAQILHSWK